MYRTHSIMQTIPRHFKAARYRIHQIWLLHNGHHHMFLKFSVNTDSDHLDITRIRPLYKHIEVTQMYHRKLTDTWVYSLKSPHITIVAKIYKIRNFTTNCIHQHDLEIRYLVLLSRLVEDSVCPHILLPIGRLKHTGSFMQTIFPGVFQSHSYYMLILTEFADMSLTQFAQTKCTEYQIKSVLFQVIYTLLSIQHYLPSFRHNDLHMSNVLIQEINVNKITPLVKGYAPYTQYSTPDGKHFWLNISKCKFRVLLCDMFYASSYCENETLTPHSSNGPKYIRNVYCDIHKFIDSCEFVINKIGRLKNKEIRKFFNYVVPKSSKCAPYNKKYQSPQSILHTPYTVLSHKYFDIFRKPPKEKHIIFKHYKTK